MITAAAPGGGGTLPATTRRRQNDHGGRAGVGYPLADHDGAGEGVPDPLSVARKKRHDHRDRTAEAQQPEIDETPTQRAGERVPEADRTAVGTNNAKTDRHLPQGPATTERL